MRIYVLLAFAFSFSALGQKFSFVSYGTTEGLPQSQVTAITEDPDGYLWVGTLGGLAKFNGKDFITYSSEHGLLNNRISFLGLIDEKMWIGHEGGVSCHTQSAFKKWAFRDEARSIDVKSIVQLEGQIYVATYGAGLFKIVKEKLVKLAISDNSFDYVRDMAVYQNEVFLATWGGVYHTRDFKEFKVVVGTNDFNATGIEKWGSELIFTTFEDGLFIYSPNSQIVQNVPLKDSTSNLYNVFVDSKRNSWVSTKESGIILLDSKKKNTTINAASGLPIGQITTVFEDVHGGIWIGTSGKGLLRFPKEKMVYFNQSTGLHSDLIMNVNQDNQGTLWLGSLDKGISAIGKNGVSIPFGFPHIVWASAMDVHKSNWFGTNQGLLQISTAGKMTVFTGKDGLPGNKITAFYRLNSSSMYIGGEEGVSLLKNEKFTFLNEKTDPNMGKVQSFEMLNNELYCGTVNGLFVYRNHSFQKINKIKRGVFCLKRRDNELWVGTEEGLFVLFKDAVSQVNMGSLPSANTINFINSQKGKMYIGTNNGMYVISDFVNVLSFEIRHLGIADGLVDLETNINSSFVDKSGFLWFGTSVGLVRYSESKIPSSIIKPRIILKAILLNYESFDYTKYSNKVNAKGFPLRMKLPYNKNNITFEMDGVSLNSQLEYEYWVEGLNAFWSPKTKNTSLSFTSLAAGSYILHVRTVDEEGVYSEEFLMPFDIYPPFYKSWWFILCLISLLGFTTFKLFRFRLKREREKSKNEMIEYKGKLMVLEQQSLNASMNRHFIFNSLNSIQYFINSQDKLSANRYLTNFAKLIRKNLDSTNEEGNMISLSQELEGLELYLSLEAMRFKDRFQYTIDCNGIDTESIIIPAMLLQPFIENCIIHGILPEEDRKGFISISMKELETNILTIQIDDNGVGIKNSILKKSTASGDHRSQGMEITTKRIDLIKKISNKGFELIGPYQINEMDSLISGTRVLLKIPFENLED